MFLSVVFRCSKVRTIGSLLKTQSEVGNVQIKGWARKVHRKGKYLFVHLDDGLNNSGNDKDNSHNGSMIQVVIPRSLCHSIVVGTALELSGEWTRSQGSKQPMELFASKCKSITDNPLTIAETSDAMRQRLHLRPLSSNFRSVLRLRSQLNVISRQFYEKEGFIEIDTPMISCNDCEGAGEAFLVKAQEDEDFFGDNRFYLPVSSQLHLEAVISGISKVYTLSPAFRAEKSLSRQHLAEFRMLEAEIAFLDDLDELCSFVERFVRFVIERLKQSTCVQTDYNNMSNTFCDQTSSQEALCRMQLPDVFPMMRYEDAIEVLQSKGENISPGRGLNKKQELTLVKHCKSPVFITHFPSSQKPFYMSRTNDQKYAECFDLLVPYVGELVGGSLRERDADVVRSRGGDSSSLDWYYELRANGRQPPSAGFGVGMERFMQSLFGIVSIKDAIPFPRWYKHCQC